MTRDELRGILRSAPLIASVQADPGTSLATPDTIVRLATASLETRARVLRLQGLENIRAVRAAHPQVPIIGLIKADYPESQVYITPTLTEVHALIETGCKVIAMDFTARARPGGVGREALTAAAHEAGRLVMADIDTPENAQAARQSGCDLISTTLAGYTNERARSVGPDLDLLVEIARQPGDALLIAEGRLETGGDVALARTLGADAVVIGGALNDPRKNTARLARAAAPRAERVGCIDLGGTWLRFGVLTAGSWKITDRAQIELPLTMAERREWMKARAQEARVTRLGIAAGGVIEPATATVVAAKGFIPDYVGQSFILDGTEVVALNDGLATAWGHARWPGSAGRRVATLALGTGVGAGVADGFDVQMHPSGDYPRLNDLPFGEGELTVEDVLGGLNLGRNPSPQQQARAIQAAHRALQALAITLPEKVVVCGGVGRQSWLQSGLQALSPTTPLMASPFGEDAGLVGAGMLAMWPPASLVRLGH
jgi:putative N-acetylmannosamine-6-phosphate epimerase